MYKHTYPTALLVIIQILFFLACQEKEATETTDTFYKRQNATHNGDYIATYPLSDADSCFAKLKTEVPAPHQAQGCFYLWYRLSRSNPAMNFRFLELYEENYPHDTVTAFAQLMRGEFFVNMAKPDSAEACLKDAHQRYLALDRPLDASDATYLLARNYTYQNNFADALQSYFEVLDLLDATDTTFNHRRAFLYNDIAVAFERSSNNPKRLFWLKKSWNADVSKLDNPWRYKAMTASKLCTYYLIENPDSSLIWAKLAIELNQKSSKSEHDPPRLVYWLARAYFKKGEYAAALPYFLDAYRRKSRKEELFSYYQYGQALGECYLSIGKLDSAQVYLTESLATPDTGNLAVAHNLLSEIYEKQGDWKRALTEAKESRRFYESKFTADKTKAVADMEARYQTAKKGQEIIKLEQERKAAQQQNLITGLLLLLALSVSTALFFRQRSQRRILEQEKKLAKMEAALNAQALERTTTDLLQSKQTLETTKTELDKTAQLLALKNNLIHILETKLAEKQASKEEGANPAEGHPFRNMKILTDDDWYYFQEQYEMIFPGFMSGIKRSFPRLTMSEIRMFLLLKLDFNNKEIADTLGISAGSVQRSRYRLRQKLDISDNYDMDVFIKKFEGVH